MVTASPLPTKELVHVALGPYCPTCGSWRGRHRRDCRCDVVWCHALGDRPHDPHPPNCTAADLAGVASGVSASTSAYLFTHPDVNWFFTSLEGLPREDVRDEVQDYLNPNPQVKADLTGIRQPLVDLKNRCGDTNGDGIADS